MKRTYILSIITSAFLLFTINQGSSQEATEKTASALYNEGLALLKAKDYAKGLPVLEEALSKAEADGNEQVAGLAKKNGAVAAYSLGNVKRKAKAYDEASALYTKGTVMSPGYSSNYIGLARVLDKQGKKAEAMTQFLEAADIAAAEEKTKKQKEAYKRAKAIVSASYKAKAYDEVISLGETYLTKDDNADVRYYIGKSLIAQDKHADAITHLDKALALSPEKKDRIIYAKAQSLEKLGKNADAVAAYKLITDAKYKESADYKVKTLK